MVLHKSLGTKSNEIGSIHYSNGSTPRMSILKGAPFNNNVVEFPNTSAYKKPSSAETWQALNSYSSIPHAVNDNKLMYVTSNVRYTVDRADVEIFGPVTHYEERWQNFIPWKKAGEGPNVVSYSTIPKSKGFIVGPEQRASYHPTMTKVDLFVKPLVEIVPNSNRIKDVGRLIYEAANTNDTIRNWMYVKDGINYDTVTGEYTPFTDDALDWIRFLDSNNIDSKRPILGIGTADLKAEGAEAVTYSKSMIVLGRDLQKNAYRHAARLGLSGKETEKFVKEYINWVFKHELYHTREPTTLSERATEERIGRLQRKYHGDKAELYGNTLDGKMHRILERLSAAYERHWPSRIRGISRKSQSKLENLANEAVREAQEMGLEGAKAEAYIESKLSENFKNYEGDEVSELESAVDEYLTDGEDITDSDIDHSEAEIDDNYDGEMAANDNEPGTGDADGNGDEPVSEAEYSEVA